jgi:hypothetical protein
MIPPVLFSPQQKGLAVPDDRDLDRMLNDWLGQRDTQRAVEVSTGVCDAIRDGLLDPIEHWELFKAAAEAQFDGPGGAPVRVLMAVRSAAPAFRAAEATAGVGTTAALRLRCDFQLLVTRSYHLVGDCPRDALENAYANLHYLAEFAGGYDALVDIMKRHARNPVAEQAVAALGIMCATIRPCTDLGAAARKHIVKLCRRLLEAYIVEGDDGFVIYPKSDAATAQGFYLLKAMGEPGDAPLIEALYRADLVARPTHARAAATRALRDLEFARFRGDCVEAKRLRTQVVTDLARHPLRRHELVLARRGHLDD